MAVDIPPQWVEQVQRIDWGSVRAAVADYGPVLTVLRDTWDRETISEIADGHLFVRDAVLNEAIAHNLGADGTIRSVELTSHEDGHLGIVCTTDKKYKRIELSGTIKEFVHTGEKSYAVYHVDKKKLPNHGLVSWLFSRLSLSMVERMVGRLDVSDRIPVDIKGNNVTVDFHDVLAASRLGTTEFRGHSLLSMVEIEGATVKEGGIMFDTRLNVPDDVKDALRAILKEKSAAMQSSAGEGDGH